jgi:hypothetical protein
MLNEIPEFDLYYPGSSESLSTGTPFFLFAQRCQNAATRFYLDLPH